MTICRMDSKIGLRDNSPSRHVKKEKHIVSRIAKALHIWHNDCVGLSERRAEQDTTGCEKVRVRRLFVRRQVQRAKCNQTKGEEIMGWEIIVAALALSWFGTLGLAMSDMPQSKVDARDLPSSVL